MKKKTGLLICVSALVLSLGVTLGIEAANNSAKQAEAIEAAGKVALETSSSAYAKIYRFTAPESGWGTSIHAYAWNDNANSENAPWPGVDISTSFSYNESSRKVYTYCTDVTNFKYLIFNDGAGDRHHQTNNITIGDNTAWYLDGTSGDPGTWTPVNQTYYLYDSQGMFGGNAKCYAWQSGYGLGDKLENASYPGVEMTKVDYGSGHLYSISLDPAFDEFICGIGNEANTGDQFINLKRGQCFIWWEAGRGEWKNNDMDWIMAHDWVNNTMHIRDVPTSNVSDTGACRGANGYYQKAKTAYTHFSSEILSKFQYVDNYADAQARFVAWARSNGETASFGEGRKVTINGTTYNAIRSIISTSNADDNTTVVVIVTFVAVGAIASYFFIGKKKKQ